MVKIQDDLYEAVNADWLKKAKIRADMPSTSSFTDLYLSIEDDMRSDTEDFAAGKKETPEYLKNFVKLYQLANDWSAREKDAKDQIKSLLNRLEKVESFADFSKQAAELDLDGYPTGFSFGVEPDFKQADRYIFWVGEPSTILPDTTYYADDNPQKEPLLKAWTQTTLQLLAANGYDQEQSDQIVKDAKAFDAKIAKLVLSREEQSRYYKNYHPKTIDQFAAYLDTIDLKNYVDSLVGRTVDKVVLSSERFWNSAAELFTEDNWPVFKNWLLADAVAVFSSYGSYDLFKLAGSFGRILTGTAQAPAPARTAYALAHSQFGFLLGDYFRRKHFSPEAKNNVEEMIRKMIAVYRDRLQHNDWLGKETIAKAVNKLDHIAIKIGYPDKIPARFLERTVDPDKSLLENSLKLSRQEAQFYLSRWDGKVDNTEWVMTPDTVNAYYDPQTNSINFPAGILQKPFYDFDRPASANYGGIGAVIAHEVSHAFDTNGARFDEKGSLNNWWTDQDLKEFEKRAQAIVDVWDGLKIDGAAINAKLILTENIADLGGVSAALQAAKGSSDFSAELFFRTWAEIWRMKSSPEYTKLLVSIDVHAPNKLRTNEPVKNFQDFFDAFGIKDGDKMFRPKAKRVSLW